MVFKSLRPAPSLLTAALISAMATISLLGQEQPKPSTAPVTPQLSVPQTNSSKSLQKSDGLRDLERSLFRPLRELEPEGSLDGVMNSSPQRPPPVSNKRMKEMMERRKNWIFMSPEEIVTGKSMQETMDLQGVTKDGDETKLLSPMERYFLKELQGNDKNKTRTAPGKGKQDPFSGSKEPPSSMDDSEGQDDPMTGVPASVREAQRNLKKGVENSSKKDGPFAHHSTSGFFSDVFALERGKLSTEDERAERALLEKYKKSIGLDPTPTFGATFSPLFADPKDPYRISTPPSLMDSTPALPPSSTPSIPAGLPTANPFLDSSSKALSPASLTPVLPKIDPPKSSLPPQPTFAAPRRIF